jgi:hypothetical protein
MTDVFEAVLLYKEAVLGHDEAGQKLAGNLADDVVVKSPMGSTNGKEALLAALPHSRLTSLLAEAEWDGPQREGDTIVLKATVPPGGLIGGVNFAFTADAAGRIARVEQDRVLAPKPAPTPVELTSELKDLVNGAPLNGTPFLVAYTGPDGQPRMAYRGTVQSFGDANDQLALWLRDPRGGMASSVPANPKVALFYTDRGKATMLEFLGRARLVTDEAVRNAVFEGTIEAEQNVDWRRLGVAVTIDLDRVEGRVGGTTVFMVR